MGFALSGFVLRAPRVAPANAIATDEPTNGVEQDYKSLPPLSYQIPAPQFTSVSEDQYRAAVLLEPGGETETEYLIFAANTADLKDRADFEVLGESRAIVGAGNLTVIQIIPDPDPGNPFTSSSQVELTDGTDRVFIFDQANRTIQNVTTLVAVRGDTGDEFDLSNAIAWNPVTSTATITDSALLSLLGGGLSAERGDTVRRIGTVLAAPTFWWTKNDRYETRFKWDGQRGRWAPLKGTPPRNLNRLLVGESYVLSPAPRIRVGGFLPGNSGDADSYSMVRLGRRPDSTSMPVAEPVSSSGFGGIRVVLDDEVQDFDFATDPTLSAIVGQTTGELVWNPAFVDAFAGQTIFYSYQGFIDQPQSDPTNIEPLGELETSAGNPLFLAPIPGPTDFPFVRIGNRQFLDAKIVDTDALLEVLVVEEGQVGVSLSTGRLKFSQIDIDKADPDSATFDSLYLGAQVFYDGLSLTQRPLQTKAPVQLVNGSGQPTTVSSSNSLFIPDASPLPSPGVSGVQFRLDGTGFPPNGSTAPGIRPNESGLVRDVRGPWDLFFFGESGQIRSVRLVDDDDEIPRFDFQLPRNVAIVDLREKAGGSQVILSKEDRKRFNGEALFFLQTSVQPAVYHDQARMFSRVRGAFFLEGDEVFVFRIGGLTYTWDAATDPGGVSTSQGGEFTPEEIVQSLNAVITGPGSAIVLGDRIALQTQNLINGKRWGQIEIGFGPGGEKDLSGPAALGFLPGWLLNVPAASQGPNPFDPPEVRFLPDNGSNLGVFRSPLNLGGRQESISDVNHIDRFDDVALVSSISPSPVVLLDRPPLEDIPGYDDGVFFRFQNGLLFRNLQNYEDVFYDFGTRRLFWADRRRQFSFVEQPSLEIQLDRQRIIAQSFRLPSNSLRVSEQGSPFETQVLNEDFLVLDGGASGRLTLINQVGTSVFLGGRGAFTAGSTTFIDNSVDVDFVALGVKKGFQLQIQAGDAQGTYVVASDATLPNTLTVEQPFPADGVAVPWELFEGVDRDTFDEGIVADVQFTQFQHLPEEPFRIRVLSDLGENPGTPTAQSMNRLVAVVGDALNSGREISLRFGLPNGSPSASLRSLSTQNLGQVSNDAQFVPGVSTERFANNNFSIRVGNKTYTFGNGDLVKVPTVTSNLTGDVIEVQDFDGLLNFGSEVLNQFEGSDTIYVEEFLDPATSPISLPQGVAEFSPTSGEINLSLGDLTAFSEENVYFVELMVTENAQDVTLNPIQGSFLFSKPLRDFQLVEAEYFLAENGTGDLLLTPPENDPEGTPVPTRVIEFLPLTVSLETATPTNDQTRWTFNPTGRTVEEGVAVYIGSTLTNVGNSPVSTVEPEPSVIIFQNPVPDTSNVRISYTVLETFGGEVTFTTSQQPVFRPPFFIEADQSSFTLETDRTADVVAGQLLRVGEFAFYITAVSYDASTNSTLVEFTPPTQLEAGSKDPSTDSISVLSSDPVAKAFNPDANDGFFIEVPNSYDPINRGRQDIIFDGNLTNLAVAGHILELGGLPFVITGSTLIDNGTRTQVDISAFFPRGFNADQDDARISGRPVYAPTPSTFVGLGALVSDQRFELILFGEINDQGLELPGRTLRESIEYEIDLSTGDLQFLDPPQGPLLPGQALYLRRTAQRGLFPVLQDGELLLPKFLAQFAHIIQPSEENNLLRGILRAQYTFSQPDSWYFRTTPLLRYLGEVADEVARDVSALLPSQGPQGAVIPPIENKNQGNVGLRSEGRNLEDEDRAARVFLEFYNEVVVAYEQVLETISGDIIGDRDGKFRFFIGRDNEFTPPGFENAITGELNRRNIFSELWFGYNRNIVFLRRDPLVQPNGASLNGDQIIGPFIDPDLLDDLRGQQSDLIMNDVDDVVLVSRTRKRLRLFPFRLESFGRYKLVGEPSRFSRIFPERAEAFTLTDPGIGSDLESDPIKPGVYAFRKRVRRFSISGDGITLPKRASTFGKAIGDIGNPVLGQITNIGSINVRPRLPRARVFAYSETGFPEFDAEIAAAGGTTFSSQPRPAVIATPLTLQDLPLAQNGLPDVSQLAAQGGETIDLTTGDPDLFTPPFTEGKLKVAFGRPDGRIIDVSSGEAFSFQFPPGTDITTLKSVFVGEVLLGCIATFADEDGNVLTSSSQVQEVSEDAQSTVGPVELFQGDTFFVTPPDADVRMGGDPNQPPTAAELEASVTGLPGYRIQFDLRVDRSDGEYEDGTFSSFKDPSILGLKEILGQRPPSPLTNLEADVRFRNSRTEPLEIPALIGGPFNDSGDYSLPYLVAPNTEKNRLGEAQQAFNTLFIDSPQPSAIYPDEIQGVDGQVIATFAFPAIPATLTTSLNAEPAFVAGQGIGPVREFDLFFVETNQTTIPVGTQGILSVGAVNGGPGGSTFEAPRFVSPTRVGDRIRYRFLNAMAFVNQPPNPTPPGIVVTRVGTQTTFDITSISTAFLVFNNGQPAVTNGGLNDIFNPSGLPYPNNANRVTINLFNPNTNTFLQSVVIDINNGAPTVTGNAGAQGINVLPTATDNLITIDTTNPFVTIGLGPAPELPEDPLNPGSSLPLEFTIDVDTSDNGNVAANTGSFGAFIDNDRLSFVEALDLRTVLDRNAPPIDGVDVFGQLSVFFVSGSGTDALTINGPLEVNGNAPFTFPERASGFTAGGDFNPNTGVGRIKVPGFEGFGNGVIASTGEVVFSAIPSSDQDEGGIICQGSGFAESAVTNPDFDNRIINTTITNGGLDRVQPGDVVVVETDVAGQATTKAGTYLVKFSESPTGINPYREILGTSTQTVPFNTGVGWAQVRFPLLVSVDMSSAQVTVDNVTLSTGANAFAPTGRLYFVIQTQDITQTISLDYIGVNPVTGEFQVQQGSGLEADGATPVPDAVFDALAVGTPVTGFVLVEVRLDRSQDPTPPNRNAVGFQGDGTFSFAGGGTGFGFRNITLDNVNGVPQSFDYEQFALSGAGNVIVNNPPGADQLALSPAVPVAPGQFQITEDAVVYPNVAEVLDLSGLTGPVWAALHGGSSVDALFPTDTLAADLRLQTGLFLEPTFPRPVQNLTGAGPYVVDTANSLAPSQVGFRDGPSFGAATTPETVLFQVRRIRRFHDVLDGIADILNPLRFVYQTRRGTVSSFGPAVVGNGGSWPFVVTAAGGTNLGPFDDPDVGIFPNDVFRLLDDDGTLLEEVEIAAVQSGTQVVLKAPGITALSAAQAAGKPFEIYLRNAPVPQEQNGNQLLDLITDQVLLERRANYTTQTGGFVATEQDPLQDRAVRDTDGAVNFAALGVQPGDLVVIDPAGDLRGTGGVPGTGLERGSRPFGDRSVPNRTVAQSGQEVPFQAGAPSELDDNRGWYRVSEVTEDTVIVESGNSFAGGLGAPNVTFGTVIEYAVYPTVSNSAAPFATNLVEGQNDLRPTAFAGQDGSPPNSYRNNLFSIAPFGYKILRPSGLFSEEAVDLALFIRERTLSFLEEFDVFFRGDKSGSYFVFQRDNHIADLGNPLIPDEGKGVISNELVNGVRGEVGISPFANTSDCLSVLDRRFYINDFRLDNEFPPGQVNVPSFAALNNNANNPNAPEGDGRPVLPDLITDVLDNNDQFRELRFSWLSFRTNREDGTLATVERFQNEFDKRRKNQLRQLRLQKSLQDGRS